jgi:antitoxin component YwqK of YwqJK toxin-antitoxin module
MVGFFLNIWIYQLFVLSLSYRLIHKKKEMNTSEIRKENLINLYNDKGQSHGYWEYYYDNGQLEYKGNYVNGDKHGYWEDYHYNGQLYSKVNYVNGKRHGYWESYYDNGQLKRKGYYDMGKKVDYNPDEPKVIELTLSEIANKLNIDVNQLRIKE